MNFNHPFLIAFGALVALWLIYRAVSGTWNPFLMVRGTDGRPSTSKLQLWLWTVVVLFSYVALYAARVLHGHFDAISQIPQNVLIVLGLSVVTATAAKGITVSFLQNGDLVKPPPSPGTNGASQVLRADDGSLDLNKIQLLAWTSIAVVIYLIAVHMQIRQGPYDKLPDIDAALMVLMGLGQGAYLGTKLVSTDVPLITAVGSQHTAGTTVVTIQGNTFGQAQNGSVVTLDGLPLTTAITSWKDTEIVFNLPATHPNGQPLTPGQQILIGVVINGHESATRLPLVVN